MPSKFEVARRAHLDQYRRDVLQIEEIGTYAHRGADLAYGHILPRQHFERNILPSIREAFWSYFHDCNIDLHKYFHHLNSSQALCFNLFFPLLGTQEGIGTILSLLGLETAGYIAGEFEFVPDKQERTSVDFMLSLKNGARILFEIKYTEADFGKAKDDEQHRAKFDNVYNPRFDDRFIDAYKECHAFFKHYQIMRNILHLRPDQSDQMVFLVPRGNEALAKHLASIHTCLTPNTQQHVHILFLEDVVNALDASAVTLQYKESIREFRQKYL